MAGKLKSIAQSVMHLYGVARSALPEGEEGLRALRVTADLPPEAAPRIHNGVHRAAALCHAFVQTADPVAWQQWRTQVDAPDSQFDTVVGAADRLVQQGDFEGVMREDPTRMRTMLRAVQTPEFGLPHRGRSVC